MKDDLRNYRFRRIIRSPLSTNNYATLDFQRWQFQSDYAGKASESPLLQSGGGRWPQPARRQIHRDHSDLRSKKKGKNSTLKLDRVEHWISKGAQPSDTVRSLIKKNKARAVTAPAESAPAEAAAE